MNQNKNNFNKKPQQSYSYYSNILKQPFNTVYELKEAEAAYYAKAKEKEDKAATKKQDALKVEVAFKDLNKARRTYRDEIVVIENDYKKELTALKTKFEEAKGQVIKRLGEKEKAYSDALKAFTDKYPEGYHITLKDGDFETTIAGTSNCGKNISPFNDILDLIFRF